jgi:hypothetical protein
MKLNDAHGSCSKRRVERIDLVKGVAASLWQAGRRVVVLGSRDTGAVATVAARIETSVVTVHQLQL